MGTTAKANDAAEETEESGMPAKSGVLAKSEQSRIVSLRLLLSSTFAHFFSLQLAMQGHQAIWLNHFKGDFAAQARTVSSLMSFSQALMLILNPIWAAACDAFGRKPVMLLGLGVSVLTRAICAMRPTVASLKFNAAVMPIGMAHKIGVDTALGDLFAGDGKGFGGASSKMMLGMVSSAMVCPLLAGWLSERFGHSANEVLAGVMEAGAMLKDAVMFKETLKDTERKPFTLRSANPLSFLQLFRHGTRLSLLAVLRMLNFGCDKQVTHQVLDLHRQQKFNYTLRERALFISVSATIMTPGYAFAGAMLRRFGTTTCMWMGLTTQALEAFLLSQASKMSTFYLLMPLGILRIAAGSAISAMLQDEVRNTSLKQGEFQGCLSNLNAVTTVVMGLLWARIYAFGAQKGRPGFFLNVMVLICGIQLLVERTLADMRKKAGMEDEEELSGLVPPLSRRRSAVVQPGV